MADAAAGSTFQVRSTPATLGSPSLQRERAAAAETWRTSPALKGGSVHEYVSPLSTRARAHCATPRPPLCRTRDSVRIRQGLIHDLLERRLVVAERQFGEQEE